MGFDTDRFEEDINEELICSICSGVLELPLTTPCDHLFCTNCINYWLDRHETCPIDRCPLRPCMMKKAPRAIRNLINKLRINCKFVQDGCKVYVSLENYHLHVNECKYNPNSTIQCPMFCAKEMTRLELASHNCVEEMALELRCLRSKYQECNQKIANLNLIVYFLLSIIVAIIIYFLKFNTFYY